LFSPFFAGAEEPYAAIYLVYRYGCDRMGWHEYADPSIRYVVPRVKWWQCDAPESYKVCDGCRGLGAQQTLLCPGEHLGNGFHVGMVRRTFPVFLLAGEVPRPAYIGRRTT